MKRVLILFLIGLVISGTSFSPEGTAYAAESVDEMHAKLFEQTQYPSAASCATCHPVHYKEWSASPHAYAQLSPVANAMASKISILTNGTNGDFCIRCHTPIGMEMGEPVFGSNIHRSDVSNEGVTCIACHRREHGFGKVSGRMPIEKGDITQPIYGASDGKFFAQLVENGEYPMTIDPHSDGRKVHQKVKKMAQISTSGFCGSCHDVNHINGFRLEEAFSEYKSSPAALKGISCQDCHMSITPGLPDGYLKEPLAVVGGKPTPPKKRTSHSFVGPDYSIVHPGIFPHNPEAKAFASMEDWLSFDHKAGWGKDEFEDEVLDDSGFPERWKDASDRYEAREILDENEALLDHVAEMRKELLKRGYVLGDIDIKKASSKGIQFKVKVENGTDGHNVPTGFDAERIVFLRVEVMDAMGKVVFQSGDLDPNGDLRDEHSLYVKKGLLEKDKYLFNLQSKFIVRMAQGGEREQVLSVNESRDPLPFLRPATQSALLVGQPANSRKHRKTIRPLGYVWAPYKIKEDALEDTKGPYQLKVQLIAGMVPVNLIHEIADAGFDYDMSALEVARLVVEGHQVLWEKETEIRLEDMGYENS